MERILSLFSRFLFLYLVHGVWTSWEPWSECEVVEDCQMPIALGTRMRIKGCTTPINGGMPCSRRAPEREECVKCGKTSSASFLG